MDHPFRSAAIGGFNRQDVLDYLEKTAGESAQRQKALEQQLREAEEERDRLAAQVSQQEEQISILNRDRENLNQQLEQVKAVLESTQREDETQRRELAELRQVRDTLRARIAVLEPDAAAFAAIKDRSAGVELEAHCRAQHVLDQADAQARELHQKMEAWMRRVGTEYDALCSQVAATVAHAADELRKADHSLQQVNQLLTEQDMALDGLSQTYTKITSEHASDPEGTA